jgi:hypothetical protein
MSSRLPYLGALRAAVLAAVAASALVLGGCASNRDGSSGSDEVSQLPWSRPQSWEGQGMLGGMMPQN